MQFHCQFTFCQLIRITEQVICSFFQEQVLVLALMLNTREQPNFTSVSCSSAFNKPLCLLFILLNSPYCFQTTNVCMMNIYNNCHHLNRWLTSTPAGDDKHSSIRGQNQTGKRQLKSVHTSIWKYAHTHIHTVRPVTNKPSRMHFIV